MEFVTWVANGFMSLFQAGGETFLGWVTGIIPMVVCLMTAINSIIKLIGEDRVLHPVTGLFPHANPGELFVYMGIAAGITERGLSLGDLAIRYFTVGLIVIFIRGVLTEKIYLNMLKKVGK